MMSRSRWTRLLALSLLGAAALIVPGPATAGKVTQVKSNVTITSGEGTEFTGKVTAGNKKCRKGRLVKLVNEPYSSAEKDKVVGTAKTNSAGNWEIRGSFMAGIYHAQVNSSYVHSGSGHAPLQDRLVDFSPVLSD